MVIFLGGCASQKPLQQAGSMPYHAVGDAVALNGAVSGTQSFEQSRGPIKSLLGRQRMMIPSEQFAAPNPSESTDLVTTSHSEQIYDAQEFLRDGGDSGPVVVRLNDQSLKGLQPEDTIVHYRTASGDVEIKASNQVAFYAPRFRSVRQVSGALAGGRAVGAAQMDRPVGASKVDQPLPGLVMRDSVELGHADVARGLDAMRDQERGIPVDSVQQVNVAGNVMAALVNLSSRQAYQLQGDQKALLHQFANAATTYQLDECLEVAIQNFRTPSLVRDQGVDGFTIYEFEEGHGRLEISKFADRDDAKPGDIVTFGIRIKNVGDGVVNEVVVVDNLTTRLEYVPDSLECEESVDFTSVANEAQSLRLQWTLQEPLQVGQGVTIQFKCRVR